ncbi:hypothetical protein EDC04DRAFT_2575643 [Pisolithus marmoratus]|nr:hypothetical protein EDC04DRAFT_2575643 [Pisolithus marmoratus]
MAPAPRPYCPHLVPALSHLRPHCLAKERLFLWCLAIDHQHTTSSLSLSAEVIDCITNVIGASWTESPKELYSTGLLVFHIFCDLNNIPNNCRCPTPLDLLTAFLASCAGAHSGSTLTNYTADIQVWHIVHGHNWVINEAEYKAILEGTSRLAPATSKRPCRAPFTTDVLWFLHNTLDRDNPCDAAIFTCITLSFFCLVRLREFTIPTIKSFNPVHHITRAGYQLSHNHDNLPVMVFCLPSTKCAPKGETVQCTPQPNPNIDPFRALENHFRVNPASNNVHLFAWRHPTSGLRPLSKMEVVKQIAAIARLYLNSPNLKGHSLCIGGMLHYLLNNIPFDVVKTMGRWSGESFTLYL